MDLSKDVIMSLWSFNFAMSYIIHKMLLFIKNNLNYFKDSIFEYFFKEYIRLSDFFNNYFFYNI